MGDNRIGMFKIIEIVRVFDNGKVAVAVSFKGKKKIFHIHDAQLA
jgi:hypothetical protein